MAPGCGGCGCGSRRQHHPWIGGGGIGATATAGSADGPCHDEVCPYVRRSISALDVLHPPTRSLSINSPVRSNPDTTIIRRVLASFGIVPGLDACRKIIVCDGFQVAGPGAAPKYVAVGVFVAIVRASKD